MRCEVSPIAEGAVKLSHVRFGPEADMCGAKEHVRLTLESGGVTPLNCEVDKIGHVMCKHDWPKGDRSSVKQHQQDAYN